MTAGNLWIQVSSLDIKLTIAKYTRCVLLVSVSGGAKQKEAHSMGIFEL